MAADDRVLQRSVERAVESQLAAEIDAIRSELFVQIRKGAGGDHQPLKFASVRRRQSDPQIRHRLIDRKLTRRRQSSRRRSQVRSLNLKYAVVSRHRQIA